LLYSRFSLVSLDRLIIHSGICSRGCRNCIDNWVIIQNVGGTPCLVIVNWLEGEQEFELAVGAKVTLVTLNHITNTINVRAFGSATIGVDLEELEQLEKAHEEWVKMKYDLSSNLSDPSLNKRYSKYHS